MRKLLDSLAEKDVDFIFYDLEFCKKYSRSGMKFEIIQIGAIKTDKELREIDRFEMLIKPCVSRLDKYCSQVTGLTIDDLRGADKFPCALKKFDDFVGEKKHIFFMWGSNDYRVLKEQVDRCSMRVSNISLKPCSHIDLQRVIIPCSFDALSLENALGLYGQELSSMDEHDALSDAVGLKTLMSNYMQDRGVVNRYYLQFADTKVIAITNKIKRALKPEKRMYSQEIKVELNEIVREINKKYEEGVFKTEVGIEELDTIDKRVKRLLASYDEEFRVIRRGNKCSAIPILKD